MKIYTTVEPVPSRVRGLLRILLTLGKAAQRREEVERLLQPGPLRDPNTEPDMAQKTISAAEEIGLIQVHGRGNTAMLSITPAAALVIKNDNDFDETFRRFLASQLLAPQIDGKPNRFAKICAWLLLQPVHWQPVNAGSILTDIKSQGLSRDELGVSADLRVHNVIYWARYLGLIWQTKRGIASGVIPDPTEFLRCRLDELLPTRRTIQDFISELGAICPVLDGGGVRRQVLSEIEPGSRRQSTNRLSDALSLSLIRLKGESRIDFDCPNDAREFYVMTSGQQIKNIWRLAVARQEAEQ